MRIVLAAVTMFALGVAASAQTPATRAQIEKRIETYYPSMPQALREDLIASGKRAIDRESSCALLDWVVGSDTKMDPLSREQLNDYVLSCFLPLDGVTAELAARKLGAKHLHVEVDGDVLSIFARSDQPEVMACCSLQMDLKRLGDTKYFAGRVRLAKAEEGFLTFIPLDRDGDGRAEADETIVWRGAKAPKPPEVVKPETIKAQVLEREIRSAALGETRKLRIYLPPGYTKEKTWPVVFLTDGAAGQFGALAEAMIRAGTIRPLVLVSAETGEDAIVGEPPKEFDDLRSAEYLPDMPGLPRGRFDKHLVFFADEMTAWATKEFNLSTRREDRMVAGYSNGGVLALYAAVRRPDVYGTSVAMSPGVGWIEEENLKTALKARFLVSGGLYEDGFHTAAVHAENALRAAGYDVTGKHYAAGHMEDQWMLVMRDALLQFFPAA